MFCGQSFAEINIKVIPGGIKRVKHRAKEQRRGKEEGRENCSYHMHFDYPGLDRRCDLSVAEQGW
jgi:hypothetical protein